MSRKRRRCDCSVCAVWSTKWMKKLKFEGKEEEEEVRCVMLCVCVEEQNRPEETNLDFTETPLMNITKPNAIYSHLLQPLPLPLPLPSQQTQKPVSETAGTFFSFFILFFFFSYSSPFNIFCLT